MTSVIKAVLDYVAPLPPKETEINWKEQLVRNAVAEIALISFATGLSCYFSISTDLRWDFIKRGITGGFSHLAFSAVSTICRYAAISERGLFFRTVSFAVDYTASRSFAVMFDSVPFIIHEGGHAISGYLLTQKSTFQVVATSLKEWQTQCDYVGLSKLGTYLGEHHFRTLYWAGGPLADVMTHQISLISALILKDSYPELSKKLFLHVLNRCHDQVLYAWSAFDPANVSLSHDYAQLWKEGGIHPYSAIIGMVAMPLISTLGYLVLRRQS